jgi:hypothetical protein
MPPYSDAAAEFRWRAGNDFHFQHPGFSELVALPTYDPAVFFACLPISEQ